MNKYEVCVYKLTEAKIAEKHIFEANNSEEALELVWDKIDEKSSQLDDQLRDFGAYEVDEYVNDDFSVKLYDPDGGVSESTNCKIYKY